MSTAGKIIAGVVVAVVLLYVAVVAAVIFVGGESMDLGGGSGTVGVLRLDGTITSEEGDPVFGGSGIDPIRTVRLLDEIDADDGIDALVLRVNSPGGSPAASWEIYTRLGQMSKPVVVSVGDVTASGAYYFACGADYIVAAPTASVGSIGVILQAANLEELFEKVGIRYTVLTKGEYKDLGSPARELTDEERAILADRLDLIYEQFIQDVAAGRPGLEENDVRELANGLTFEGTEAVELGLIDRVGSYRDALDLAAESAGLDVADYDVRVLGEEQFGLDIFSLLFGTQSRSELVAGVREAVRDAVREVLSGQPQGLDVR